VSRGIAHTVAPPPAGHRCPGPRYSLQSVPPRATNGQPSCSQARHSRPSGVLRTRRRGMTAPQRLLAHGLTRHLELHDVLQCGVATARPGGNRWAPRRRPGDLRHTGGTTEGCYLPVLTWFAGTRCTGPDRHLATHRGRRVQVPLTLAVGYPSSTRAKPSRRPAHRHPGGMRERPNRHAWKACVGRPTVGSNPTPSADPGGWVRFERRDFARRTP
jgi:hypothetical protein